MTARPLILAAATLAFAPPAALAQPATIYKGDAYWAGAVAAPGGGAFTPWNPDGVALAPREGDGFGAAKPAFTPVQFEKVWGAGLDSRGAGVIVTLRRHAPYQRVRASFRSADGAVTPAKTISAKGHSASGPSVALALDGCPVEELPAALPAARVV